MRVLFLNSDDKEREIHRIYLENILDEVVVLEFIDAKKAINFLSENDISDIKLILASDKVINGSVGIFYEYVKEKNIEAPFILFSEHHPESFQKLDGFLTQNKSNDYIITPIPPVEFRNKIINAVFPNRLNIQPIPAFQKIRLINFYRYNSTLCNVFIKLSNSKYVKVIQQGNKYTKKDIDKFKDKGIEFLYIRNDDFQKFGVTYFKYPFLEMETDHMSNEELNETLSFTHTMIQDLVTKLGFSKTTIEMTEKSVSEVMKMIEQESSLEEILLRARRRNDYLYDHSYMTSIICTEILRNLNWANREKTNIMCMASFFHDITLDDHELAKISDVNDEELKKYPKEVQNKYIRHPLDAASLLLDFPNIPTGVSEVIMQHHENGNGTGFPNSLRPTNIGRLSCVFIIAHDFVNKMVKSDFDPNQVKSTLEKMSMDYQKGQFKNVMEALYKNFKDTQAA